MKEPTGLLNKRSLAMFNARNPLEKMSLRCEAGSALRAGQGQAWQGADDFPGSATTGAALRVDGGAVDSMAI